MDTMYFRRGFGVMVFRDAYTNKNLFWKFLNYETNTEYKSGIEYLKSHSCNVLAIVCDGRRGLFGAFDGIPVQMCHFHQKAIIKRYLTSNPQTEAGKELRKLVLDFPSGGKDKFVELLENWHKNWQEFLLTKTINMETGKSIYTHKRMLSAYRSLKTNLQNLFTYFDYPELKIPKTTNSLEGTFSGLKTKLRTHSGLTNERKIKLVNELLR